MYEPVCFPLLSPPPPLVSQLPVLPLPICPQAAGFCSRFFTVNWLLNALLPRAFTPTSACGTFPPIFHLELTFFSFWLVLAAEPHTWTRTLSNINILTSGPMAKAESLKWNVMWSHSNWVCSILRWGSKKTNPFKHWILYKIFKKGALIEPNTWCSGAEGVSCFPEGNRKEGILPSRASSWVCAWEGFNGGKVQQPTTCVTCQGQLTAWSNTFPHVILSYHWFQDFFSLTSNNVLARFLLLVWDYRIVNRLWHHQNFFFCADLIE